MRKIEILQFELRDTAADIQRRREEREVREGEEEAQKQREEARKEETTVSRGMGGQKACKDNRSDTEMDTVAGTSQSHSRHKKGQMTNIYLTRLLWTL